MATDWQGLAGIVLLALLVVWVARWIGRQADRNMQLLKRRFVDPQGEAVPGTGVERESPTSRMAAPSDVDSAPRSPQSPVVVGEEDPRPATPTTTGPQSPGCAVDPPGAALPGLQRTRRTVVHG